MKKIRVFGRHIPLWLLIALLVTLISVTVAVTFIGKITMHWEIQLAPEASMSKSVSVPIGTLYTGETKSQIPTDTGADLIVKNNPVDLIISLDGDYGGFDSISVTLRLVKNGQTLYEAVLEPTIVVSKVLSPSPTGVGGWSSKEASTIGEVERCFVRVISGEGDLAQLVKWVPGAKITVDGETFTYPETPFGYTYDETIPETGYIFQNDDDAGESIQLVLVYPHTSATIENVQPGTYDIYIGYTVRAGNVPTSGDLIVKISYDY